MRRFLEVGGLALGIVYFSSCAPDRASVSVNFEEGFTAEAENVLNLGEAEPSVRGYYTYTSLDGFNTVQPLSAVPTGVFDQDGAVEQIFWGKAKGPGFNYGPEVLLKGVPLDQLGLEIVIEFIIPLTISIGEEIESQQFYVAAYSCHRFGSDVRVDELTLEQGLNQMDTIYAGRSCGSCPTNLEDQSDFSGVQNKEELVEVVTEPCGI